MLKYIRRCVLPLITFSVLLSACADNHTYAPVTEAWLQPKHAQGTHVIEAGDTLYSIAWRYGLDYRDLARINNIKPPYSLKVRSNLKFIAPHPLATASRKELVSRNAAAASITHSGATQQAVSQANKTQTGAKLTSNKNDKPVAQAATHATTSATKTGAIKEWNWPIKGPILNAYSPENGINKGIDIGGKIGAPVKVAASGRIVYAGNGLHGYGELIIVKHNDEFLSAYAHNRKILVKEGQNVKAGQVIAEMGNSESRQVMLHFEIRRAGIPVNPFDYLPSLIAVTKI